MTTLLEDALHYLREARVARTRHNIWWNANHAASIAGILRDEIPEKDQMPDLDALTETVAAILSPDTVIVSAHDGAVEWLERQGIACPVFDNVTADQIRGKRVIGNLPIPLAAEAAEIVAINIDTRGEELTADQMEAMGAKLIVYRVEKYGEYRQCKTN